jgi:hypothetical protein
MTVQCLAGACTAEEGTNRNRDGTSCPFRAPAGVPHYPPNPGSQQPVLLPRRGTGYAQWGGASWRGRASCRATCHAAFPPSQLYQCARQLAVAVPPARQLLQRGVQRTDNHPAQGRFRRCIKDGEHGLPEGSQWGKHRLLRCDKPMFASIDLPKYARWSQDGTTNSWRDLSGGMIGSSAVAEPLELWQNHPRSPFTFPPMGSSNR